ncbi:hypothetical protein BOX15_Mlig000305g7 [Macrostomum lignano]|uniref:Uncharacterized protein n=1 Tax=Macrostomum lignano TaxID=282301 RepID=A0A267DQ44_9PLAT|nr:hypothetical protein BOX15_Mlig000305g10 [Macrostomum lignano]PAA51315.1 hypothetical protein BOX15_Mlig000305g7 [Macrostomum lignano]
MPPKAAKSKTTKTAAATASAKKTQKQQKVSAEVEADDSLPSKSTPGKKRRRTLPIRPARQGGHCVLISHLPTACASRSFADFSANSAGFTVSSAPLEVRSRQRQRHRFC